MGEDNLLRENNDLLNKMYAALFGIDGNNGFVGTTKQRLDSHTGRIGVIEKWMWMLTGGGMVVAFLVAHHLIANVGK